MGIQYYGEYMYWPFWNPPLKYIGFDAYPFIRPNPRFHIGDGSQKCQNSNFLHLFVALLQKHISPKELSRNHISVK